MNLRKGITLIEVLVVISIVTILLAIIIFEARPKVIFRDTKQSKRLTDQKSIQEGLNAYVSENGTTPSSLNGLSEGVYDICKQGQSNCTSSSVNLDALVNSGLLSAIPVDPDCTSTTETCYDLQYIPQTSEFVILNSTQEPIVVPESEVVTLPTSINAEDLNIIINGTNNNDRIGGAVSYGDVNNDGYDDAVIGAVAAEDGGSDRGRVYVVYGAASKPASIDVENANVIINGVSDNNFFGYALSAEGDINNDGYDDIVVTAIAATDTGTNRGRAYIFYGGSAMSSSIDAENANVIINGVEDGDQFGYAVAAGGDVNNDGYEDLIITMQQWTVESKAYVFLGSSSWASSINAETANLIINGTYDAFASKAVIHGDINNDNYDDIVIAATGDDAAASDSGAVYVFYGASSFPATMTDTQANFIIRGQQANDFLGSSLDVAPLDNDGNDDLLLGSPELVVASGNTGKTYLFYGSTSMSGITSATNANATFTGTNDTDNFGLSVSIAGDLDNDGYQDIAIGGQGASDAGLFRGRTYVFRGGSQRFSGTVAAANANVIINGTNDLDYFHRLAYKGDLNNDGFADLLISAPGAEDTGMDRGRVYVYTPTL